MVIKSDTMSEQRMYIDGIKFEWKLAVLKSIGDVETVHFIIISMLQDLHKIKILESDELEKS